MHVLISQTLQYVTYVKGGCHDGLHAQILLTLCQLHYMYLREDMVQIVYMYVPLEASAIVIREVRGCHNTVPTMI